MLSAKECYWLLHCAIYSEWKIGTEPLEFQRLYHLGLLDGEDDEKTDTSRYWCSDIGWLALGAIYYCEDRQACGG